MRRFSQRNPLVTLSEINITPLLDLAFVLLIIFVIISPSIKSSEKHGMELNLPKGGGETRKVDPKDRRVVEINKKGEFMLDAVLMTPDQIERELVNTFRINPNLVVFIRADEKGEIGALTEIISRCQENGIYNFQLPTLPRPKR